jgi:hypothetical protein
MITLPTARSGRKREQEYLVFAEQMKALDESVEFKMSARGWCYVLEEHAGLKKAEFDAAEARINTCRKEGFLPLDFTAADDARAFKGRTGEEHDHPVLDEYLDGVWAMTRDYLEDYSPHPWVEFQPSYTEVLVEKIDLVSLFEGIARENHTPISNARGDFDINGKARMYQRFQNAAERGQQPVLLYCGDFDPKGLLISSYLRKQFEDLRWREFTDGYQLTLDPDDIIIERFGLNFDQIEEMNLSKVPNLITGSGKDLADLRHPDRIKRKPYIEDYLRDYGIWKCEANALVTRPKEGRLLFREAVNRYVSTHGREQWMEANEAATQEMVEKVPGFLADRLQGLLGSE